MLTARIKRPRLGQFREFEQDCVRRMERAALSASDRASVQALRDTRTAIASARLGRLGGALTAGSDLRKSGRSHRGGSDSFSASGWLAVRTRSERALGALDAYTQGAKIAPRRGRWLWIATDQIPARVGRYRMTPERYRSGGLEQRIGSLTLVRSINGRPLLVIKGGSVSSDGKSRSAYRRKKGGDPFKGRKAKEFIVAFIGIPATSRRARIDVANIVKAAMAKLPTYFDEAL